MKYGYVAASALTALLCACGGGGSTSSPPIPTSSGGSSLPASATTVGFTISVPATTTASSSARKRPQYVSPNTGSIRIALQSVNGTPPATSIATVAAISSTATGCSAGAQGLTCTVTAAAAQGVDVFAISTYQSANATGPVLATTTVSATVGTTAGPGIPLSLGGVPASIAFSPAQLPLLVDGGIHRFPVTLNAADASGATIVGAAPYQSPLSLQVLNDPAHALTLSTSSVAQPGTVVTITYDSSKQLVQGRIVASDTAMSSATLNASPLSVNPMPLTVFDDASSAVVTLTEGGFTGNFAATVANAADASATIVPGGLNSGSAVVTLVPKTHFDVTSLNVSDGNVTDAIPLAVVPHNSAYSAFGNAHQLLIPANMVEGPDGTLWTADQNDGALVNFNPATGVYSTFIVDPTLAGPLSIAFDATGNIWFADGPQIGKYTPATAVTTMFSTGLQPTANITSIVAGPSGQMWFFDDGVNNPGSIGNPTFFGSIATGSGQIQEFASANAAQPVLGVTSMVLGKDNGIWFTDGLNHAVGRIAPATGTITEFPLVTPATPQQSPMQLAVAPDGKIWMACFGSTSSSSVIASLDPANNDALVYYTQGVTPGLFLSFIAGSDGNLWFTEDTSSSLGFSSFVTLGVVNPKDGSIFQYPTFIPQFSIISSMVDRGDGTLFMLDSAVGNIGKVSFK